MVCSFETANGSDLIELCSHLVDFTLGFFFGLAISRLELACQLFALTINLFPVVISEFAPLLFCSALEFGPFAFNLVPVHRENLLVVMLNQIKYADVRICLNNVGAGLTFQKGDKKFHGRELGSQWYVES